VEEGAKVNLGGVAEGRRNAGPGAALDAQYATGTTADGFTQVNECTAELGTAAEGDVLAGASIAEQMRRLAQCLAMLGPSAFSIENRLQTIFGVCISDRFMPLILLIFAANVQWKSTQTAEGTTAEDIPMDQDAALPLKEEMPWMSMPQKPAEAYNTPKQREMN